MVLVCGHICEAGSRVEARQERDTAFSVGRQEAGGKHLNDEADNFQSSLRVPWSLSSICCIARTRVSEQNRVTVSGVTRIQLLCLAQAHSTWHPRGRRPLPFVATTFDPCPTITHPPPSQSQHCSSRLRGTRHSAKSVELGSADSCNGTQAP